MTLEDPFFVVKDEVCKALNKTRGLYQRWGEFHEEESETGSVTVGREDFEWTNTELRNALRSIEWDLEDLEETINILFGIVEKNPKKFKIDSPELSSRRKFIQETKKEVQFMKEKLSESKKEISSRQVSQSEDSPLKMPQVVTSGNTRYSRLVNEADSPNSEFIGQTLTQQEIIIDQQNDQLDQLASSMGTLKTMSRQIGHEVDEQAVMLDDFGHEMEHTQSKMENTLGKIARVMRLTNDRRQWAAIGALSGVLIIVIILFFTL